MKRPEALFRRDIKSALKVWKEKGKMKTIKIAEHINNLVVILEALLI